MTFGWTFSLRAKMIILAIAGTLATGGAVSIFAYDQVRRTERDAASEQLEASARLHASQLRAAFNLIRTDAEAIAAMPAISGIIRSSRSPEGLDTLDRSDGILWRRRLEMVFAAILETRPHYSQLRYVGVDENWRELVRVNRLESGLVNIRGAQLQSKGDEVYLQHERVLAAGKTFFSRVTYNREHGRPAGPPMIRLIHPVLDEAGIIFGTVVINADFGALIRSAGLDPAPGTAVHVVTDSGDHASFGVADDEGKLFFHQDNDWTPSDFATVTGDRAGELELAFRGESAFRSNRIIESTATAPLGISLVTVAPQSAVFLHAGNALIRSAAISAALTVLAGAVAGILGARMTEPLSRLAAAVRERTGQEEEAIALPVVSDDEIGELAQAFTLMANDLLRQTLRARAIHEGAADGIITIDETGVIEDVNPAAGRMFGYNTADLVGEHIGRLMPDGLSVGYLQLLDRMSNPGTNEELDGNREVHGRRRDGSDIPIEVSVSRLEYGGAPHLVGLVRDISMRKANEARVSSLVKALERSNAELDKFAYVASHDLKAPLRVIDNASRWLEEDLEAYLDNDTRESMQMLRGRVLRMERLLDDLLAHSLIGRTRERSTLVSGPELVASLTELLNVPKGMTVEFSSEFEDISLQNMPITTVLLNLLSNAIKHHDRSDGFVRLGVAERDSAFVFSVADDGPGIDPKYHGRVFEMFQTLRPRDEVDGSGLGLSMVQKYVSLAGGTIEIVSDGVNGTVFTLVWPKTELQQHSGGMAA